MSLMDPSLEAPTPFGYGTGISWRRPETPLFHGFRVGARPAIMVVMTDGRMTVTIPGNDPTAVALLGAVHGGDVDLVLTRLDELLLPDIDADQISQGFWHACAAGERRAAERLLGAGADLNWEPDYAQGTALDAADGLSTRQNNVIEWLQSIGAGSARAPE